MKKSKNLSNFFFEDMIIKCHHVFINPNLLKAKYPVDLENMQQIEKKISNYEGLTGDWEMCFVYKWHY